MEPSARTARRTIIGACIALVIGFFVFMMGLIDVAGRFIAGGWPSSESLLMTGLGLVVWVASLLTVLWANRRRQEADEALIDAAIAEAREHSPGTTRPVEPV